MPATRKKTAKRPARRTNQRPFTPEDLQKFIFLGDPQISPDGSRILFTRKHAGKKNEYATNLWMVETSGTGKPQQFTSSDKDGHGRFSPDGSTIAFISSRVKTRPQIFTMPASGGEAIALTDFPEGTLSGFKWSPDGASLAVMFREQDPDWTEAAKKDRKEKGLQDPPRVLDDWWYRLDGDGYFNAQRFHLYLVDLATGKHRKIYAKDNLGMFTFDFAPDSKQLVIATNRSKKALIAPEKTELLRLNIKTGKLTPIPNLPDGPKDSPKWSPNGKYIAYAGRAGNEDIYSVENLELFVCDPRKGGAKSVTKNTDYCLLAVALSDTAEVAFGPIFQWRSDSKRLLVKLGWHGETHIASVSPSGRNFEFLTSGGFDHDMGNCARDSKSIAMTRSTTSSLSEVLVGAIGANSIRTTQLTNFNTPLLKLRTVAKVKSNWIKTSQGTKVQVWTMLPPGFNPKRKYPAILEIHGGPHAQYGVGFFHEFQMLASAGYIVMYSNPRGSKGYGQAHTAAIKGDWGTADWTDMQAVIDFMREHPNVNPKKMGVMGGSYGGYMTNWIIGHTREFAGAITDRCVSNMVSMGGSSDWLEKEDGYFPGNFWDRPEPRWKQSPIKHIGNARTPTLIIHSEGDLRCNIEQAEQVFVALKLLGVPTRFVRYPKTTSHGMSRSGPPDMRLHRLHQILEWWKKYL